MADEGEPSAALLAARAAASMQCEAPMSSLMLDGFGLPASDGSIIPAGTPPVKFNVSFTSSQKIFNDVNMSMGMDVAQLKEQLFAHVNPRPPPNMQKLTLHHLDGSIAAELGADTDRALLASYGPMNGWEVRVHDSDAGGAQQQSAQPEGGGAPSEVDASWATQVSDWTNYPRPPESKRG